jgi:aryl-alcohol dehydrogenase-like predicted oxidoreductase
MRSLRDPPLRLRTTIEETIEALHDVVKSGKARYLGASSMWAWQFAKMLTMQKERGLAKFVSMQNLYNLVYREEEREMIPLCRSEGIALTPYSPNARGFLAGNTLAAATTVRGSTDKMTRNWRLGAADEDTAIAARVGEVAARLGVPRATVLAWVLAKPGITFPSSAPRSRNISTTQSRRSTSASTPRPSGISKSRTGRRRSPRTSEFVNSGSDSD